MIPLSMHFLALDLQPPQGVYSILTAPMVLDQQLCLTSALMPTLVSPLQLSASLMAERLSLR